MRWESSQSARRASNEKGLDKEARVFIITFHKVHLRRILTDPYSSILLTLPKGHLTPYNIGQHSTVELNSETYFTRMLYFSDKYIHLH